MYPPPICQLMVRRGASAQRCGAGRRRRDGGVVSLARRYVHTHDLHGSTVKYIGIRKE